MNIQQQEISTRVGVKIQALMAAYDKLRDENLSLMEKNQKLEASIKQKDEMIQGIEKNNSKNHLSQAFVTSSSDVHEAKERVKRIVREIDNCITLLNR